MPTFQSDLLAVGIAKGRGFGQQILTFGRENPVLTGGVGAGILAGVGGLGLIGLLRGRKKTRKRRTTRRSSPKRRRKTRRRGKRQTRIVRRASRRKAKIHYTKKGQPYILMRSGKARFIRKSTAKRSKRLKGGMH